MYKKLKVQDKNILVYFKSVKINYLFKERFVYIKFNLYYFLFKIEVIIFATSFNGIIVTK